MTAQVFPLLRTVDDEPISPASRARLAGQTLAASIELNSEFSGVISGWRIVIGPIREQRQMIEDDLGVLFT